MLYLLQTSIPNKKLVHKALVSIYGVGAKTSKNVCQSFGILESCSVKFLRRTHQKGLRSEFSEFFRPLGTTLKNLDKTKCQRLIDIQSYSGRRHKFGYPVRGQRTHTNANTQRKLHKRWLINTYEKPKFGKGFSNQSKDSKLLKNKKTKEVSKVKPKVKKQQVQKAAKYKIS